MFMPASGAIRWRLLDLLTRLPVPWFRKMYWDLRAPDIHHRWGEGTDDFETLTEVIGLVRPTRLLDIGCGSGRCFPLYVSLGIPEVVGQDISGTALRLCRERHPGLSFRLHNGPVDRLPYGQDYFDLIVSSRTLSAVPPLRIPGAISALAGMGRHIYLNEMSDSDYCGPSRYWYKHDYHPLLAREGFSSLRSGIITVTEDGETHRQTWILYGKEGP